jgi:hypothetical protein
LNTPDEPQIARRKQPPTKFPASRGRRNEVGDLLNWLKTPLRTSTHLTDLTELLFNRPTRKTAYELPMERLNKTAPRKKLTEAQKRELAELDPNTPRKSLKAKLP